MDESNPSTVQLTPCQPQAKALSGQVHPYAPSADSVCPYHQSVYSAKHTHTYFHILVSLLQCSYLMVMKKCGNSYLFQAMGSLSAIHWESVNLIAHRCFLPYMTRWDTWIKFGNDCGRVLGSPHRLLLGNGTLRALDCSVVDYCPPPTNPFLTRTLVTWQWHVLTSSRDPHHKSSSPTTKGLCHLNINRCHSGGMLLETIPAVVSLRRQSQISVFPEMLKTSFNMSAKVF